MKFTSLGVNPDYPEYLNRKIVISNMIALIIAFLVALPFVFISLIFFPPLAYLPIVAVPIALTTLFFNFLGLHQLGRTVITLVPVSLAAVYQAYLSHQGMAATPGLAMIMLSFSLIVFVIFDLRERAMLIAMSTVILGIMLSMDYMNDYLEMDLETAVIETGFLAKMVVVISIISGAGCILIMAFQNRESEAKAFDLVKQSEFAQQEMLDKEQALKENLQKLEQAQIEEGKRQWINEGLAKGMIILRNQSDLKKLADDLISFIVRYVEANQGGLFMVRNEDKDDIHLELVAAYAYERKKFIAKRVEVGSGLVGQAYLEKDKVILKKVPDDYVQITSGLGLANPNMLLIIPLITNEEVQGIIELASFKELDSHQIHFIETFGESIGAHYRSVSININTQNLLAASQQQTEEMRAQEEEMRQNMEELNATQEEMARKEKEYIAQIKQLENVIFELKAER